MTGRSCSRKKIKGTRIQFIDESVEFENKRILENITLIKKLESDIMEIDSEIEAVRSRKAGIEGEIEKP